MSSFFTGILFIYIVVAFLVWLWTFAKEDEIALGARYEQCNKKLMDAFAKADSIRLKRHRVGGSITVACVAFGVMLVISAGGAA